MEKENKNFVELDQVMPEYNRTKKISQHLKANNVKVYGSNGKLSILRSWVASLFSFFNFEKKLKGGLKEKNDNRRI